MIDEQEGTQQESETDSANDGGVSLDADATYADQREIDDPERMDYLPESDQGHDSQSAMNEENQGVSIRARPPLFFFWPTLAASLLFCSITGFEETKQTVEITEPTVQEKNNSEEESDDESGWSLWLPRLPRPFSLALMLGFSSAMGIYFVSHLFFHETQMTAFDQLSGRNLIFKKMSLMDFFRGLIVCFLIFSPAHGLLALMSFYAFGLMTDHQSFTQVRRLRSGMVWVIGAMLLVVVLELLHVGKVQKPVVWQSSKAEAGILAAVFFLVWAFNMFVLAFDFNGTGLVALSCFLVLMGALFVLLELQFPHWGIQVFFSDILGGLQGIRVNSSFYYAVAFVLSTLMVFSGLVAKADFWQITPTAIIHRRGIIKQNSRHYGALANFHYHVEYPDYFESVLGGQSGIFILSLPREERPEIVEHVWYARHYDRQIQKVLSEVGVEDL